MALLKFICNSCGSVFEELTSSDKKPPCPNCESEDTQRYYQGKCYFGASSSDGGGSSCSSGSCSSCSGCSS